MKTVVTVLLVLALVLTIAAGAGAKLVRGSKIIARLDVDLDKRGGWVKIDKDTATPSYERVYCITLGGQPSCDWGDVRTIPVSTFSRRR